MEEDKDFYNSMNPKLSDFYNLEITEVQSINSDLYPIQEELKTLKAKFEGSKKVGTGGMKEIFEVKDLPSGRRVAKARLKDSANPKDVESFLREARLTASLQHPNIIRIYDIGYDQEPWFSMELIEGPSLEEEINQHREESKDWPLFQRLEIFNKICDALAYAHSQNTLHLDIKPDNIRLGPYGEVLVCDWGLAYILYSETPDLNQDSLDLQNEHTMHGYIRGTPGYMAPERVSNSKTVQADVFSLGALLYALLNFKAPFTGSDHTEILENTLSGKLQEESSEIPIGIKSVYQKALEVSEEKRYKSVRELQLDVQKFRNGFATDAEEAGFAKQFILLCKRNRLASSLAALFMTILSIIAINYVNDIKESNQIIRAEKNKAENALKLYQLEQEQKLDIAQNFSSLLVESTRNNTHGFDIAQSIKKLEYALQQDPENSETWLVKAYTHFVCHQFAEAYYCFEKSGIEQVSKAMQLSLKYKNHKGMLSPEENVKLLKEFGDASDIVLTFVLLYDGETRDSLRDHSQIVKYFIEYRNKIDALNFKYDESSRSLDLSNNVGLFHIDSDFGTDLKIYSLIKFLDLKRLDLTNTNLSNLNQLKDLDLEVLNLANTPVMDLRPLLEMKSLKQVIINKSQAEIARGNWTFKVSFTEEMGNRDGIEQAIKSLLNNFQFVDSNQDNGISLNELIDNIPEIRQEELTAFFVKCDINKNEKLSLNEINNVSISELKTYLANRRIIIAVFNKFDGIDKDKNGGLSIDELKAVPSLSLAAKDLQQLDKNKDGLISKKELIRK